MTKDEIGRILKEARTEAELTQQQVAELINRPQQTVAGWETGRSQPDADTLFRLFDIYGKSVDETFGLKRKTGILLSIHESKIIDQYRELDDYGQKAVDGLLEIEHARCTAAEEELREKRAEYKVAQPEEDLSFLEPIAAHNDNLSPEQLALMRKDLEDL